MTDGDGVKVILEYLRDGGDLLMAVIGFAAWRFHKRVERLEKKVKVDDGED